MRDGGAIERGWKSSPRVAVSLCKQRSKLERRVFAKRSARYEGESITDVVGKSLTPFDSIEPSEPPSVDGGRPGIGCRKDHPCHRPSRRGKGERKLGAEMLQDLAIATARLALCSCFRLSLLISFTQSIAQDKKLDSTISMHRSREPWAMGSLRNGLFEKYGLDGNLIYIFLA